MSERTVTTLYCDFCEAVGTDREAAHRVRLVDTITGRKGRVDLCPEHGDALFGGVIAAKPGRRSARKPRIDKRLRCPLPGNDGYEGPGQGMFQHFRHAHPGTPYDDEAKEAARAAWDAEHKRTRRKGAA